MTNDDEQVHEGLWAAGLSRRVLGSSAPPCVGCRDEPVQQQRASELTLLWRRSKGFRRHRIYK